MQPFLSHLLILCFVSLWGMGCNVIGKQSCVPGETRPCICSNGEGGVQVCSGHGTSLSGCSCGDVQPDGFADDGSVNLVKPCINANECNDANPCTTGLCGADGFCVFAFNTTSCDDADECTVGDRCFEGACTSGTDELACQDANPCTDDECVQGQGCVSTFNELECEDADPCTLGDRCDLGSCEPGPDVTECDEAQAPDCAGDVARTFGSPGTCTAEGCDYPSVEQDCTEDGEICLAGACVTDPGPDLILNGSLLVNSEAKLEEANQYKEITGDLEITGDVPAQVQLPHLIGVGGTIWVHDADAITELGFPKLEAVGVDVDVEELFSLERIAAPVLASIGASLRLKTLPACYQVQFTALTTLGQDLWIEAVDGVTNLVFNQLKDIAGDVHVQLAAGLKIFNISDVETISGALHIEGNPQLTTLHAQALSIVGGELSISKTPKLLQLDLSQLETVGSTSDDFESGSVRLHGLTALNKLFLPKLSAVRGRFSLNDTAFLDALNLDALTHIGELHLSDNAGLASLSLPVLSKVNPCWVSANDCVLGEAASPGWVSVSNMSSLKALIAPSLEVLTGVLQVDQNPLLKQLKLPLLDEIGALYVEDNATLQSCDLGSLAEVGGNPLNTTTLLSVTDNVKLVDLELGSLQHVFGGISLNDNGLAGSLDLSNLKSAKAFMFVGNASSGLNVSSLGEVSAASSLIVSSNSNLEELTLNPAWSKVCWAAGLAPPAGVWGEVKGNPLLPQCAVAIDLGCGTPGPCEGGPSVPCPVFVNGNRLDCECIDVGALLVVCEGGDKCGGPEACNDANPCTEDLCTQAGSCYSLPTEGACDDGDPCKSGDICLGGVCTSGPDVLDCDDDNPCTDDSCIADVGCEASPNDSPCDDGSVCTLDEACSSGACTPGELYLTCDDGNSCTVDACDPVSGCIADVDPNLLSCDDGDPCTLNDQCLEGVCAPGNTPNPCDDSNACTLDACQPGVGCAHGSIQGDCDDGDPCTIGDFCETGACEPGPDVLDCSVPPEPHCNENKLYAYLQVGYCVADICLFVPTITDCADAGLICENASCVLPPG